MVVTWICQQCGWPNDNNPNPCRRCGGDEDAVGKVRIAADPAKIAAFDAARAARDAEKDGGKYDVRRSTSGDKAA